MARVAIEKTKEETNDPLPSIFVEAAAQVSTVPIPSIELTEKEKANIENFDEKAFEEFIKFITESIDNLQKIANIPSDPSFMQLNNALVKYESTQLSLIFLYEQIRFEKTLAEDRYTEKFNDCYCKTRDKYNPHDLASTKYLSTKELERWTEVDYYKVLKPLKNEYTLVDHKLSALRRMMDEFGKLPLVLNTLSKNVQTEVNAHFTSGKGTVD